MSGSFASLNTALSAMRFNRVAMDTASQNIANVGTAGYTRRRVESASEGTPVQPAMWSRTQGTSGGVRVTGLTRMTDALLDARVRTEHGKQSYLDVRQGVLDRLETGIGEPGDNGLSSVLAQFRKSWADLANNPSSGAARSQVIAGGASRRRRDPAPGAQLHRRGRRPADQAERPRRRGRHRRLRPGRHQQGGRPSPSWTARTPATCSTSATCSRCGSTELTGGKSVANGAGGLDFIVGGVPLVTGSIAGRLEVASGVTPTGDADGSPVTFEVVHPIGGTTPVTTGLSGEVGAATDLLNTTIPAYVAGLNAVAQTLADGVNALHQSGYDETGAPGGDFFSYDPTDPSGSLAVALTDNSQVAAAGIAGGVVDGGIADALSELTGAESAYQTLVNGFGSTVASGRRLTASQSMLTEQVDGSRDQMAGVNLDEEMLAMVQYQRAYEASARVLTTVDSMLDTLINRTGLLR